MLQLTAVSPVFRTWPLDRGMYTYLLPGFSFVVLFALPMGWFACFPVLNFLFVGSNKHASLCSY